MLVHTEPLLEILESGNLRLIGMWSSSYIFSNKRCRDDPGIELHGEYRSSPNVPNFRQTATIIVRQSKFKLVNQKPTITPSDETTNPGPWYWSLVCVLFKTYFITFTIHTIGEYTQYHHRSYVYDANASFKERNF